MVNKNVNAPQVFKVLNLLSLTVCPGIEPLYPFFHCASFVQGRFWLVLLSAFLLCTQSEIRSFLWRTTLSVVSSSLAALGSFPEVIPPPHLLMCCLWPGLLTKKKPSPLELFSGQFRKTLQALLESRTPSGRFPFCRCALGLF